MLTRRLLLYLAARPSIRNFLVRSPLVRGMARRFVAGEDIEDALRAAQAVHDNGFTASLDYLGESVSRDQEAAAARDVYLKLLAEIHARRLDANVSVKLTQMGLDLSTARCKEHLASVVERAASYGNFVRVDMEGSDYTERTLRIVRALRGRFDNVGAVLQSYLYRTEKDAEHLLAEGLRIRLCKGAYQEPASVAYQRKADVDANFIRVMKRLLSSGLYHGIATHDPRMIEATRQYAQEKNIGHQAFEFQMLYGIRRDLQANLLREGYRMRIYIPFGGQWFPYLTRRLAESPANLLFFLRNLFRG